MKIMLLGSMTFASQMLSTKSTLEQKGHEILTTSDLELMVENPELIDDLDTDFKHLVENDILRFCFNSIADSDAVLVLNHSKNSVEGYCGTSVCMELGLAFFLRKKIYLLNPLPSYHEQRWAIEIASMLPKVLNGDISKL